MYFMLSLTNIMKYNTFFLWSVLSYMESASKIPLLLINHSWLKLVTYYGFPVFTLTLQFHSLGYKNRNLPEAAS